MRTNLFPLVVTGLLGGAAAVALAQGPAAQDRSAVRRITWGDLAPLHTSLAAHGLTETSFPRFLRQARAENARRVHEGDLDHLVFYLLQSTAFTTLPPIEPALSAKRLVDRLEPAERLSLLKRAAEPVARVAPDVRARVAAFLRTMDSARSDERLAYFSDLVTATFPRPAEREAALHREYVRVMRFVYEKEFVAPHAAGGGRGLAALYQARGLSTDTAVEAGFVVSIGLGVVKGLDPGRLLRRVLIVGPGLDLAPRTGFRDERPVASYQPWAVMDALLALGLAREAELEVVGADINPRVVEHLRRARIAPPVLRLMSEVRESDSVTFTDEYREYLAGLGRAIGDVVESPPTIRAGQAAGRTVRVRRSAANALRAERLDIVTERLAGARFDLIVATNILPYFDDAELMLAMSNVAAMLEPGGVFLHNEPRPSLGEMTMALGLSFEQSRHVTIATVRGAAAPLSDSVFLHRREKNR